MIFIFFYSDVAVPVQVPATCQKCSLTGKCRLQPGKEKIAVVTEKGTYL